MEHGSRLLTPLCQIYTWLPLVSSSPLPSEVSPLLGNHNFTSAVQIAAAVKEGPEDSGLFPQLTEEILLSSFSLPLPVTHTHTHTHISPSIFSRGRAVKWSHYEIHTHSRRALQRTPVSKPPQVFSLWYMALTRTSGRSRYSLSPENISMQTVWESYAGRVCLHVLLCSSAVSLWHLTPEGTSNPITDLNKGNGSKASIPLILRS